MAGGAAGAPPPSPATSTATRCFSPSTNSAGLPACFTASAKSLLWRRNSGVSSEPQTIATGLAAAAASAALEPGGIRVGSESTGPFDAQADIARLAADIAVTLREHAGAHRFELLQLEPEPSCWRTFTGPGGQVATLKPDLLAVTADPTIETHSFIEVDLGAMNVGDNIHASQVKLPKGVALVKHGDEDPIVVGIVGKGGSSEAEGEAAAE